jgi:hypothetical protein
MDFTFYDLVIFPLSLTMVVVILYNVINDSLRPFVHTDQKPPDKWCGLIRYEPILCSNGCNFENFYKRTILGYVGWSGGVTCIKCASRYILSEPNEPNEPNESNEITP